MELETMTHTNPKTEQENYAQRSVRHCLDMLAPFEVSEQERAEGQSQFYEFMVSLYKEMYQSPEKFFVFPAPYEEYLAKGKRKKVQERKEKEHVTDSRESTLRNTFQQAIQFYAQFFYYAGLACQRLDESSGALILSKGSYSDVLGRLARIHDSKYNESRYEVLSKRGLRICEEGDTVSIVHASLRRAMEGVLYLCKAPDSKYRWMNFLRLDYKNAYSPIPPVEDICKTLPKESVEIVRRLEEKLAGKKVKVKVRPLRGIVSDFRWKVEYAFKGRNLCGFYADNEYLMVCIYFNRFENINELAGILYEQDRDLFQWFQKQFPERLCKCPSNRRVVFGGEPRRICGLSNRAEIVNPGADDIEKALYLMEIFEKRICGGTAC